MQPVLQRKDRLASAGVTPQPAHPVDVLVLLTDADRVLMAVCEGTGYADRQWNLRSGMPKLGEDAVTAVIGKTFEEIGVRPARGAPRVVATVHHCNTAGLARVGLVFTMAHNPRSAGQGRAVQRAPRSNVSRPTPSTTCLYKAACVWVFRDGQPLALSGWN